LSLVFCLSATAFGQETTGGIEGYIKDPAGAVVPNVTVTITSSSETASGTTTTGAGAGFRRTITTNDEGFFRVLQVPPGTYNVVTTPSGGFAEARYENVTVAIGRNTQLEITANPGTSVTTVDVNSSDAPPVDTTSSAIQTTINAQKIELLPRGTGFAGLLRTVPGARPESRSGGFSVDGASGGENVFVIDGQEVTNYRTGTLNETYNIPTQLVQEVQVKSSGFEAQYGGATGGVVSVVTRGGNNDFHGEFGIQFEPPKFRGNPRPDLYRFTSGTVAGNNYVQTAELIPAPKAGGTDVYYTSNLSGPIIRDRLWFYTSYSPQVFNTEVVAPYFTSVPAATRTLVNTERYSRTTTYEYAFARLDSNPFNNLRLSGTFLWNPVIQQGSIPHTISFSNTGALPINNYGGTIGSLVGNQFASRQGGRQTSNLVTFSGVYTPWNNVVVEGRYNRAYLNEKQGNYFIPSQIGLTCGANAPASFGCSNTGGNSATVRDVSIRETYDFNGTYIFNAGGRHELRGGYQRIKTLNDVLSGNAAFGSITFNWTGNISSAFGITPTPGAIGWGVLARNGTFGRGTSYSQGIFIQDKYQPFRRLTLNLGVRSEKEELPSFNQFPSSLTFDWNDKIAPRLGFALDIFGDGKTKAFGSYGKFFDRVKFSLPRGLFGGTVQLRDYFEVFPGDTVSKFNINSIVGGFTGQSVCQPTGFITSGALSRCQENQFPASNGPSSSPFAGNGAVDVNSKPFQQTEFTVGMERQLSQNYLFRARYTFKNVDETIEDMQVINAATPAQTASIIGNPGKGLVLELLQQQGYPKAPEVQRRYDGLEFVVEKRLSNNWYFNANYTYSRLYGNYSGLASSDEPHLTGGRLAPNTSRAFDLPLIGYTVYGEPDNGRLPTDRPHVFNIYGAYIFDWKGSRTNSTEISGFQTVTSGTPQTTYIYSSSSTTPQILYGRGDLGRSPVFSQTDLAVTHRYRFGRDNRFTMAFDVNASNLLDQDTVTSVWTQLNIGTVYGSSLGITNRQFNIAWQNGTLLPQILNFINASPDRQEKRYGQPFTFQSPRAVRFGFRFLF